MEILSVGIEHQVDRLCLEVQNRFYNFLKNFTIRDRESGKLIQFYIKAAERMLRNNRFTLLVNFSHLAEFAGEMDLAEAIIREYFRHEPFLKKALQKFMQNQFPEVKSDDLFFLSFSNIPIIEKVRDLRTSRIGKLMCISGTVTRMSEVSPELSIASFYCLSCNREMKNIEQQFKFTEPKFCTNTNCTNKTKWELIPEGCIFNDFQKLRVQENPSEIPAGSMPRSVEIILRNEIVEMAKPGDKCFFVGTLTVLPSIISFLKPGEQTQVHARGEIMNNNARLPLDGMSGLKSIGVKDISYKMVFIANHVEISHNRMDLNINRDDETEEETVKNQFTEAEIREIESIRRTPDIYSKLASCITPSVFGHEEVKKGILLMLFGGVNKKTMEGMSLRGDLNVCLVGDPSTAKSQFLKWIASFLPRSVYTSGKATSASGLTASVQRDPETGETCLDAGALMLANNGVCCIDEFDKMDSKDQVAIHEAMEQQTISIAKAGIQATLIAKTSILAAANPIFGRYDKSKSLRFNVNLSEPIMSRFDLFFVILDECNKQFDETLATHIVRVHRFREKALSPVFTPEEFLRYLQFARLIKPHFTKEAAETLQKAYISLRINDVTSQKSSYRITVRQLESLIRLSEGLARVHCSDEIKPAYVKEAARLLSNSIIRVEKSEIQMEIDLEMGEIGESKIFSDLRNKRQREKTDRITISSEEYETLILEIMDYIKENDFTEGVRQGELVNRLVELNLDKIQDEEGANKLSIAFNTAIQRMITYDKVLIISVDSDKMIERVLSLHPNRV